MTHEDASTHPASGQSDLLLWLAAAAVCAVAVTWLLMLAPWRGDEPAAAAPSATAPQGAQSQTDSQPQAASAAGPDAAAPPDAFTTAAATITADATTADTTGARIESQFEDPLTTAQLALEAGMLVEPEAHSAWTLFSRVLADDPDNETARQGRERVAELLVARADAALEQGRVDDARAVAEHILGAFEEHGAATALAARIEEATRPPPEPAPEPEPEPEPAAAEAAPAPDPVAAAFDAAHASFKEAMRSSRLLTPVDASARHFVDVMLELDAEDERGLAARDRLFEEFLSRSRQALEALDTAAARTWIDEAEKLDADPAAVERARMLIVDTLVARESERRVPISSLELVEFVPPEYPDLARRREVEGWVDVEFTVARDGTTRDIGVADGSHESLFRDETIAAVEQWRFEPRVFMDRRIDQRTHTRIRFDLD